MKTVKEILTLDEVAKQEVKSEYANICDTLSGMKEKIEVFFEKNELGRVVEVLNSTSTESADLYKDDKDSDHLQTLKIALDTASFLAKLNDDLVFINCELAFASK